MPATAVLIKGKAFRLKPNGKYIIVLDPHKNTREMGIDLVRAIDRLGVKALVAFMEKDSYKIIEETSNGPN
jgi:hypothetical protein